LGKLSNSRSWRITAGAGARPVVLGGRSIAGDVDELTDAQRQRVAVIGRCGEGNDASAVPASTNG
jgi:hypothetical protein